MKIKLVLLIIALVSFISYSGYVYVNDDVFAYSKNLKIDSWNMQILLDLSIACILINCWMIHDAIVRKKSIIVPIIYIAIAIPTGTIGLMMYLIHREIQILRENNA